MCVWVCLWKMNCAKSQRYKQYCIKCILLEIRIYEIRRNVLLTNKYIQQKMIDWIRYLEIIFPGNVLTIPSTEDSQDWNIRCFMDSLFISLLVHHHGIQTPPWTCSARHAALNNTLNALSTIEKPTDPSGN